MSRSSAISSGLKDSRRRLAWAAAVVLAVFAATVPVPGARPADQPASRDVVVDDLCTRALTLGYNLDHAEAVRLLEQASALDPDNPKPHRLAAAAYWTEALFQQGAITAEDFLGETKANKAHTPPSRAIDDGFHTHIARALALAEARVDRAPRDADAHFQLGAAVSFQATWTATVEGGVFGAVRLARRAYNEQKRVLELDPSRTDAGLLVGMYRYTVSTLSMPKRLVARLVGFGSDHDAGLRLIERAATTPSHVQTDARFTLIVIYTREGRFDDALAMVHALQAAYPRNRLLWLEEGNTLLRARRFADARRALDTGFAMLAADPRPRATGEEARWQDARRAAIAEGVR